MVLCNNPRTYHNEVYMLDFHLWSGVLDTSLCEITIGRSEFFPDTLVSAINKADRPKKQRIQNNGIYEGQDRHYRQFRSESDNILFFCISESVTRLILNISSLGEITAPTLDGFTDNSEILLKLFIFSIQLVHDVSLISNS